MEQQIKSLKEVIDLETAAKGRALITWIELEGEWTIDTLQHLLGDSATVRELSGSTILKLKREIEREAREMSFVLYASRSIEQPVLDALQSIIGSGITFKGDDILDLANKLGSDEMALRRLKSGYPKFFSSSRRIAKLEKVVETTKAPLSELALLAALTNSTPDMKAILQVLLRRGPTIDSPLLTEIEKMGLTEALNTMAKDFLSVEQLPGELLPAIVDVIITSSYIRDGGQLPAILFHAQSQKVNQLAALYQQMLEDKATRNEWRHATNSWVERYRIKDMMCTCSLKELLRFQTLIVADEILLERLTNEVLSTTFTASLGHWRLPLEQRALVETVTYQADIHVRYAFFTHYIELRELLNRMLPTVAVELTSFNKLYEMYVTEEYKIDQTYRQLSLIVEGLDDERLKICYEVIQMYYERDYLEKRSQQALRLTNQTAEQSSLPIQTSFYEMFVRIPKLSTKARQFVIISDAFRYEAGIELTERLQNSVKASVTCHAMLASAPTFTKLGMASLLPQTGELTFQGNVVCLGGESTSGLANREKLLSRDGAALTYHLADFMKLRVSERRELIRGKEIVYLYHDTIDAIGDKGVTEHKSFAVTFDAINEIEQSVKALLSMEAKRITVTADHGYMFLSEKSNAHTSIIADRSEALDGNNRFLLFAESSVPSVEYGAVELRKEQSPLVGTKTIIADSLNRFRRGSGTRFMHGGVTAQERITPVVVIDAGSESRQVELSLPGISQTITSHKPKFAFYQADVVQSGVQERLVRISLEQNKQRISNVIRCLFSAKKRSELEQRIELKLFELDYPLQSEAALVVDTPDGNGGWTNYQTYPCIISIIPN